MIALSIIALAASIVRPGLLVVAGALFVIGWIVQFIGHGYERKPPEFFKDWRFLLVGLRWWFAKMKGRA
jgi:uncharacterized membrane protein YGL010W